jgi:RNA polymerase sigma-70 factor (family 1)
MSEIDALRKGDEVAFEDVFNRFHQKLYFFFLKHTADTYKAEELVQVTFVKLWQYRQNLSSEFTLSEQIFRIAKTSMIDAFRKSRNEQQVLKEIRDEKQTEETVQVSPVIDFTDQLQKSIHTMPPVQQKVFLLSRYEGLSNKEIAKHLSISPKTVERHITRALYLLRKVFASIFF